MCVCVGGGGGGGESHFAMKALGEKHQHQRDQRFVSHVRGSHQQTSFFFSSFFSLLFSGAGEWGVWVGGGGRGGGLFCNFPCRRVRYIIFGFISLFIFLRLSLCNNFIFH